MKKLLYVLMSTVVMMAIAGCTGKPKSEKSDRFILPEDSLVMPYEDELFSLMLPQGWTWETDTCETWQIKHIVDSLKIKSGIVEFYPPDNSFKIRLEKSAMRWVAPNNPISDWCALVQSNISRSPKCVYISEIADSIRICGNNACNYWAAFDEDGDTIIYDQYIVVKEKYDLYYLSGVFNYGDENAEQLWHKILSIIKLK